MSRFRLLSSGKVRDTYIIEGRPDLLAVVATDRISAYDVVMDRGVVDKGRLLSAIADLWFAEFEGSVRTQVVDAKVDDLPDAWYGRTAIVRRAEMVEVECVVRGYLAGSAYREYRVDGTICGQSAPGGLLLGDRLPHPYFTPTTKAHVGHDELIAPGTLSSIVGAELARRLEELSIDLYTKGYDRAAERGFVIADTKFEFGFIDGELALCDEVLTPDSSRYWDRATMRAGSEPPQLDKQVLRDWLDATDWDHRSTPPPLPDELTDRLSQNYRSIYERLSGKAFSTWPGISLPEPYLGM